MDLQHQSSEQSRELAGSLNGKILDAQVSRVLAGGGVLVAMIIKRRISRRTLKVAIATLRSAADEMEKLL